MRLLEHLPHGHDKIGISHEQQIIIVQVHQLIHLHAALSYKSRCHDQKHHLVEYLSKTSDGGHEYLEDLHFAFCLVSGIVGFDTLKVFFIFHVGSLYVHEAGQSLRKESRHLCHGRILYVYDLILELTHDPGSQNHQRDTCQHDQGQHMICGVHPLKCLHDSKDKRRQIDDNGKGCKESRRILSDPGYVLLRILVSEELHGKKQKLRPDGSSGISCYHGAG